MDSIVSADARQTPLIYRERRTIEPGEIWVIEQRPQARFFAFDREAVAGADLVVFDPALAALVEDTRLAGSYAEPLASDAGAILPRLLQLASDGWSVVRLVAARPGRRAPLLDRLARFSSGPGRSLRPPLSDGSASDLPVAVIAKNGDARHREVHGHCEALPEILADVATADALTVILGPLGNGYAAGRYAAAANGLAG